MLMRKREGLECGGGSSGDSRSNVMTYSSISAHLYSNFSHYRELWSRKLDETEAFGAFVFLPDGYSEADSFDQVKYNFWLYSVQAYIEQGGQSDEGLMKLLIDFNFDDEFCDDHRACRGAKKHAVHVTRLRRWG